MLQVQQRNEALPGFLLPLDLVFLVVGINTGLPILDKDIFFHPAPQRVPCLGIVRFRVLVFLPALGDPHDVVRRTAIIVLLRFRRYFVVGLSNNLIQVGDYPFVVTVCSKGE